MRRFVLLAFWCLLFAACSGGRGGTTSSTPAAPYLTADTQGIASAGDPAAGAPAPPEGTADFGGAAEAGREQVARQIEEADLYRVSGRFLYLLNAYRGLVVVDLEKFEIVGRLQLAGFPVEMYLRGTRGFVMTNDWQTGTKLLELDLANPTVPALARSASVSGGLRTSRVVGDVLYAVTDSGVQSFLLAPSPFEPADMLAIDGGAEFAHANDAYIFITAPDSSTEATPGTQVTIVDIADPAGGLSLRGTVDLPGYVADDQKLDFAVGVLRIVTHDWADGGLSRLFTIDVTDPMHPAVLGTLELARGEQLFATRFDGGRAYVVTFEQVDPLWIIDLSDPAHPVVAGELEVPGFATQIVADGDRLVCLGIDTQTWNTIVSLFDVSNPSSPALLDREDLGSASTDAHWERRAFGVTPGLILVPSWDGLSVIARDATTLTQRGKLTVAGGALRGFALGTDLVAAGSEEVVVADAATLDVRGRVTVAENVIDAGRLVDGRLVKLVQTGDRARLGGVELKLWADALYVFGNSVAVLGWGDAGRAAYVVSFNAPTATVSKRLDLGAGEVISGGPVVEPGSAGPDGSTPGGAGGASGGAPGDPAVGVGFIAPAYAGADAVMTGGGKLVVRGRPAGMSRVFGEGESLDGLVVIDIPAAALATGIEVQGGAITGMTSDGPVLAFTFAHEGEVDVDGRPLVRQEYVRIDLDSGAAQSPVNVPGYVLAAAGEDVFVVDEQWGDDWSLSRSVVAARVGDGEARVLDRLPLPERAYDLRAAGSTLFYTEGNDAVVPVLGGVADTPMLPSAAIHTVRLGTALASGPDVGGADDASRWLLLPQDGAALIVRDAATVERWDVSASVATLSWSSELSGYPLRANADPAATDRYLIALGYAGMVELP